ncbi:DUF192 domain-containing protein [Pseudooceanicola sp.]|uniref:DUF192 domain-containing protein n=1 Tax=Pseudooceanicola sp. TaxID=1914328 RepID=UPI004059E407
MRLAVPAVLLALMAGQASAACRPDAVELRGDWGAARFRVEVVDTPETRAQGLMFVEEMAPGEGMLFVYPAPQPRVGFWMKNTLIPLDMIFMDATGTVRKVHTMAQPHDETLIPGGEDIQYVLELNGGVARDMGIGPGTELRHPEIDPDTAAWAC